MSSLVKKYLMALTGFVLVGFVCGHMLGNLQMFLHPDWINEYAYKLQHLPYGLLWVVRLVLLITVIVHVVVAVQLVLENRRARGGENYAAKAKLQATFASKTMRYTGLVLLAFIIFHILHFTVQSVHPEFKELHTEITGTGTLWHVYDHLKPMGHTNQHDVYAMVGIGFSPHFWYVPAFYIFSMALLCMHLTHGVASMFQSLGLRNSVWTPRLRKLALVIGWVVFLGFSSLPVAGLLQAFPHQDHIQAQYEHTFDGGAAHSDAAAHNH
ncbi:MAG: succinate dehydrogenase cytochrome b556 subunit [Puniceicoccaceae bacterium 5H]|nr:MAG: succinate dehydrogenase cytochrome b556 subunit [Puniceicoccaceae bacterium 5H]